MNNSSLSRTVIASITTVALLGSGPLLAECIPVKGKILNTLHDPALGSIFVPDVGQLGGVSTLGVVSLHAKKPIGNLKCALVGVAVDPGEDPGNGLPPLPSFEHSISCDDKIETPYGIVHSQLLFDTSGQFTGSDGVSTLSFIEHSVPRDGSGTGVFEGATGGQLTVEGTSNVATKSIDMKFSGEVCMD
jgi:hypothetical protein